MNRVRTLILGMVCGLTLLEVSCQNSSFSSQEDQKIAVIAESLVAYRDHYGEFPPVFVSSSDGFPFHSWRVLVLPFLEANSFTEEYDFKSAWDGETNRDLVSNTRLIERSKFPEPAAVGRMYRTEGRIPANGSAFFLLVDSPLQAKEIVAGHPQLAGNGFDGHYSNDHGFLLLIELNQSDVHWMKPRDILFGEPLIANWMTFDHIRNLIVRSAEIRESIEYRNASETLRRIEQIKATSVLSKNSDDVAEP